MCRICCGGSAAGNGRETILGSITPLYTLLTGVSEGAISPRRLKKLPKEDTSLGVAGQLSQVSDTGSAVQVEEEKIPCHVSP